MHRPLPTKPSTRPLPAPRRLLPTTPLPLLTPLPTLLPTPLPLAPTLLPSTLPTLLTTLSSRLKTLLRPRKKSRRNSLDGRPAIVSDLESRRSPAAFFFVWMQRFIGRL